MIGRILGFPFFCALALIGALALWLTWCKNFIRHGGEAIAYSNKLRRKTITDVFFEVEKLVKEKEEKP